MTSIIDSLIIGKHSLTIRKHVAFHLETFTYHLGGNVVFAWCCVCLRVRGVLCVVLYVVRVVWCVPPFCVLLHV